MPTFPSYTVQYLHTPNILYLRLRFPAEKNDIDYHKIITIIIKDFTASLNILLYYLLSITYGYNLKTYNKIIYVINIVDSITFLNIFLYHLLSIIYNYNLKPFYDIFFKIPKSKYRFFICQFATIIKHNT